VPPGIARPPGWRIPPIERSWPRTLRPTVSIVVPAHNEEALLPRCLDALLAQDYSGPLEILVIDNASTDRTAALARRPGIRLLHEPVRDYSHALICGFSHATGEIIALTDADTVVPRDWVSRLTAEYERDPQTVAVGGDVIFERPNWKGWLLARLLVPAFTWFDRRDADGPHLWGANFSVRRTAFDRIGGWNPQFSLQVDSEISERLNAVGRVAIVDSIQVRTSCRRWNRAFLSNLCVYVSNYVSMKLFAKPLWRDFAVVREEDESSRRQPRGALAWVVVLLALAGVGTAAFWPWSSAFGKTYWHGDASAKVVALSFDDGPNGAYTSRVLDILRREHVRATFFLIGERVRLDPATAARIVREGHVVGNHTEHHPIPFALEPASALQAEVSAAEESIRDATGQFTHLFRPPNGLRSPWLMRVLESDSLVTVTWDDAPGDWNRLPVETIVERTVRGAHSGSIILLHDGLNGAPDADQDATVRALPGIIRGLRARGFDFVTVPELLHCPATLSSWPPARHRSV
jgi:peptidoglycan/xylan/chitin deacetylase (PgdA/CDA1 family)/GT2 family glycosyltransferase